MVTRTSLLYNNHWGEGVWRPARARWASRMGRDTTTKEASYCQPTSLGKGSSIPSVNTARYSELTLQIL